MTSRFPIIPHEELDPSQSIIEAEVEKIFKKYPQLTSKDENGGYYGPYPPLFYTPDLIEPWFKLASAVTQQKRLTAREKELAILAVMAVYKAPYVLYAHSQIAVQAGLSADQISHAVQGSVPENLTGEEAMTYKISWKLASSKEPLNDQEWDEAQGVLGRTKIAGLTHLVCGFVYVSLLTNIGDGHVPK